MPRGDKSKYTDKQERKADHIAEGYEKRGVSEKEAERRAWATVNKDDGGGKKEGGSGRSAHTGHPAAHKGGKKGGAASAHRPAASRVCIGKEGCCNAQAERSPSRRIEVRHLIEDFGAQRDWTDASQAERPSLRYSRPGMLGPRGTTAVV